VADEEKLEEERHQVGREEFRGMNGLGPKYNLIVVGAGLSGAVVAERASRLLGIRLVNTRPPPHRPTLPRQMLNMYTVARSSKNHTLLPL
jgi:hypothetical protein